MAKRLKPKLVSIGSISAASLLVRGFQDQTELLTAIVPTTDTGSSTGIIRERFSLPAPGDVRAVLAAMSSKEEDKATLGRLFEYRFKPQHLAEFTNMALGNLVLAALTDMCGSFSDAVKIAGDLLGVKGKVLPVTTGNTHLVAVLDDGREIESEKEIRTPGKAPIESLFLRPSEATLGEGVAEAIMEADMIVIGPGCFYTSILACLVVPGLPETIRKAEGIKMYCCNTTSTPGQTDGLSVFDHVKLLVRYLEGSYPEYVLINNKKPRREMEEAYRKDNILPLLPAAGEWSKIRALGSIPIAADLIEDDWKGKRTMHKLDSIRHDPRKVRAVLLDLYRGKTRRSKLAGKGVTKRI